MFHYSDLGSKKEVTILLAVLTALLPDAFMFVMAGVLIALHTFSVSLEAGAIFVVLYIIMYCVYVRFFPKYAYAMFIVPIFYPVILYGKRCRNDQSVLIALSNATSDGWKLSCLVNSQASVPPKTRSMPLSSPDRTAIQ